MRKLRMTCVAVVLAAATIAAFSTVVFAQWPTTCVDLNDIVETHLGNDNNVGIYQRVFGVQAEAACQNDHRDDVRGVFAWAFDEADLATQTDLPDLAWPTDCVELNDIVEAHLGNDNNVEIYQRVFGDQAEPACRNDHRADVRAVFAWAFDDNSPPQVASERFVSISTGSTSLHTCALRTDGSVACWGDDRWGQATPPAGRYTAVSAGWLHTCGLRADGAVDCWGDDFDGQATPPAGTFTAVSAGARYTCGLRRDGVVDCWGADDDGQATPPAGTFAAVSAGDRHTCGVRSDGAVECWGDDTYGAATPRAGTFTAVSAGLWHTCGVRPRGSVECWGEYYSGQSTPPGGTFASVSAGAEHTCGVQTDGTIACWGRDDDGAATPPAGTFAAVSARDYHSCGVRTDGTVECWGRDHEVLGP